MRKLGWIYIIFYCIDALFSLVASFEPSVELMSNFWSMGMLSFGIFILIFICMGSLRPVKVFVPMLSFNALALVFGFALTIPLLLRYGPQMSQLDMNIAFFREEFGWYWAVHWFFMTLWLAVCAFAVVTYSRFMVSKHKQN